MITHLRRLSARNGNGIGNGNGNENGMGWDREGSNPPFHYSLAPSLPSLGHLPHKLNLRPTVFRFSVAYFPIPRDSVHGSKVRG